MAVLSVYLKIGHSIINDLCIKTLEADLSKFAAAANHIIEG